MRLIELLESEQIDITEGPILGKSIKRGIQGAALGTALAVGLNGFHDAPANKTVPHQTTQQAPQKATPPQNNVTTLNKLPAGFPKALEKQDKLEPTARKQNFAKTIVPYIKVENNRLLQTRNKLLACIRDLQAGKQLSHTDKEFIDGLKLYYKTSDLKSLLRHVDTIPISMVLAQAAIESSWGMADITKQGNVFFGQKTWSKTDGVAGTEGERYAGFSSPAQSIRAYMRNLNTHPAYEDFRNIRAELRKKGDAVSGTQLVHTLVKYSSLGPEYAKRLLKIIHGNKFTELDKNIY
jgi:Bax protein